MKIVRFTAIPSVALVLAGCWGDRDKSAFVDFCLKMGASSKGYCTCQYELAKTDLDEEVFAIVMAGAKGDQVEAERLRKEAGFEGFLDMAALSMILLNFESKTKKQCGS